MAIPRTDRHVHRQAMGRIRRADFVLRNADRMGDAAYLKWIKELADSMAEAVHVLNDYLVDVEVPDGG